MSVANDWKLVFLLRTWAKALCHFKALGSAQTHPRVTNRTLGWLSCSPSAQGRPLDPMPRTQSAVGYEGPWLCTWHPRDANHVKKKQ